MNATQKVALVPPELITAVPKKDGTKGICQKFKDAVVSIYNMPLEVKVLGVVGAVCAVGSAACFLGMAFAPSVSFAGGENSNNGSDNSDATHVNEAVFTQFNSNLPKTILTSEKIYLSKHNRHSKYDDCNFNGTRTMGDPAFADFLGKGKLNSLEGNPENYDLTAYLYKDSTTPCDIKQVSLARDRDYDDDDDTEGSGSSEHEPTIFPSDRFNVDGECNIYDFTSTIKIDANGDYGISEMLNCIKTNGTLADFLDNLAQMSKKIMEESVDKQASREQLRMLANAYEQVIPEIGIKQTILFNTGEYANEPTVVQDVIREGLLKAGVALSSISALALVSSGILAGVSCAKSKASVHYNMEGYSISVSMGGKKTYLELYDPCLKTKLTEQMLKALRHLLFYGADLGESYEMVVETADKIDTILGHNAVGTHMVFEVQQWLHNNYQTRFTKYRDYVGLDFTPGYSNTATSAV